MGCFPSKSFKGEGHRLGSAPSSAAASPTSPARVHSSQPIPHQAPSIGAPPGPPGPPGRGQGARSKAAEAAAKRADAAATRGTNSSNPQQGKLSDKLNKGLQQDDELPTRIIYD